MPVDRKRVSQGNACHLAILVLACLAFSAAGRADYLAGPTVPVSGPSPFASCTADAYLADTINADSEVEPSLAVDPLDRGHLAAAWQQDRVVDGSARGHVVGVSFDAGATWQPVVVPGLTPCSGGSFDYATEDRKSVV